MSKDRLWSPMFVAIIACTLCCFLVGQGSNAGTSVYLERIGGSTGLAGIGALIFSLSAALSRIVTGPLSDVKGRRIVMLAGSLIMIVGTVGPLFGNSDALFIVWRVFQGFGFAAATTASATAAADVLPLSRLGEGIGYYGLGQAISMSIGPALAIFLISTDPPENFYIGLTCCGILATVFAWLCRYETCPSSLPETSEFRMRWERGEISYLRKEPCMEDEKEADAGNDSVGGYDCDGDGCDDEGCYSKEDCANNGIKSLDRGKFGIRSLIDSIFEPTALPGTIPMMLIATSFGFGIFFMGVFGNSLGVGNSGIFYTVSAVSMIVIRLTSSRFMDKVRPIYIMGGAVISGLVCYGMQLSCAFGLPGEATEVVFYIAGIPYGLSLGVALPINQTIAVRLSPPDRWGAANGLYLLGNDMSIGIASLVWGFANEHFGYAVTICAVMCCIALSFVAALICYPKEGKV